MNLNENKEVYEKVWKEERKGDYYNVKNKQTLKLFYIFICYYSSETGLYFKDTVVS